MSITFPQIRRKKEEANSEPKGTTNVPEIDKAFTKMGHVVYHKNGGYKTINLDDKGEGRLAPDDLRATDTFPAQKTLDYINSIK